MRKNQGRQSRSQRTGGRPMKNIGRVGRVQNQPTNPPDDWTRWMEEGQPSNWMPQICIGMGAVYCRDLFPFGRRLRGMF